MTSTARRHVDDHTHRPGRRMVGRRARARTAGVLAAALCALIAAAPAGALGEDDGLWYVEAAGLDEVHERATGEGITVAVIDNRINPDLPEFQGVDLRVPEDSFCEEPGSSTAIEPSVDTSTGADHGTSVAAMVIGNGQGLDGGPGIRGTAPGVTLYFYAATVTSSGQAWPCSVDGVDGMLLAIEQAVADGVDIISISRATNLPRDLGQALALAQRSGAIIVVASPGPSAMHTFDTGLAGGNGVVVVEAAGPDGLPVPGVSISHPLVTVAAPGAQMRIHNGRDNWDNYRLQDGTSLAAPWVAGALALVWSEHPEATGNQIIQTLVRHTFQNNGDLSRHNDAIGYGTVSILNMLNADPTTYPDTNPLLRDEPLVNPPIADITGTPPPENQGTEPTPGAGEGDPPPTENRALPRGLVLGAVVAGGALVLTLAAVIVIVVVRGNRKGRS
ncbi:S8 family serine peptidase [Cellulomonas bogoriensis]